MTDKPGLELRTGPQRTFLHVLLNTVLVSVVNYTLWFAVTFWIFLETRSVFATGMIAGIFLVTTALTGIWFGSLVDHHAKKTVLQASAVVSFGVYEASLAVYLLSPPEAFQRPGSVLLWLFVVLLMLGVIAGNVRMIALSTLVTLLIPADRRGSQSMSSQWRLRTCLSSVVSWARSLSRFSDRPRRVGSTGLSVT